ncbi:tetratricopeptide repeat protein [Xanthobacter sp. AM11]|uniref:tetratricopeptide repeat protein n=1 Tax=Xanthobacter sp. AM11 TaxID=3380643 RepID=UPI0039BFCF82
MRIDSGGPSAFARAMAHLSAGDIQSARRLMREAADADHLPGLSLYASFVEHGVGGKPNVRAAMIWFERAARHGDHAACVRLAGWHLSRNSRPQAKFWLSKAMGYPPAMVVLSCMYAESRSVRATREAKLALQRVLYPHEATAKDRAEFERLRDSLSGRTADAIWSRHNRKALGAGWEAAVAKLRKRK